MVVTEHDAPGGGEDQLNARDLVARAVESMPDQDVASVLTKLLWAMTQDDQTLAATVREHIILISFGLMAFGGSIERIKKMRPRGRPKKSSIGDIDCRRACMCWLAVRVAREITGTQAAITNREAISVARFLEHEANTPPEERLFQSTTEMKTIEESVSKGKTKLGFVGPWECPTCETIMAA